MDARPHAAGRPRPLPLSPAQIVAIGLVAASIGGAAWLVRQRPEANEAPLLDGTALDAAQLAAVEAALDRAGLTDYRTESGQVWVPRSRQSAYKRAVVDGDALPKPWGTRFQQAISEGGMWVSPAARAESLKVARQDELALVVASMPGIERAAVLYDEARGEGFRQESIKTASVGIRSAAGMELDAVRAHGIRVLVASSVAGLEPEHVAVTDLTSGRVFAGPLRDDVAGTGLDAGLARRMAVEGAIAGRLRQALEFVPGVIVAVSVEHARAAAATVGSGTDGVAAAVPSAAANAPAEVAAAGPSTEPAGRAAAPAADALPGAVRVTVSLPDSYLDTAVAATRARARRDSAEAPAGEAVARGEIDRVRDLVMRSLPGIADPERLEVLVTSHPSPRTGPGRSVARVDEAPPPPVRDGAAEAVATTGGATLVTREQWMALASVLAGATAGALWWAGSRGRAAVGRRRGAHVDADADDLAPAAHGDAVDRRLAA